MAQNSKGKMKANPRTDSIQEDIDRIQEDIQSRRMGAYNWLASKIGRNKVGKGKPGPEESRSSELPIHQPSYQENRLSEEPQLSQQPSTGSFLRYPPNRSPDGPSGSFFEGSSGIAIKGGNFNQTYGHHTNVTANNVHFNLESRGVEYSMQQQHPLPALLSSPTQVLSHDTAQPPVQDIHLNRFPFVTMYEHGPSVSTTTSTTTYSPDNSNKIYERYLEPKKRGFPLWIPEPSRTLPMAYRRKGINIGDVGIITPSGGFSFLFNICLPHDNPVNPRTLPDGFAPIDPPIEPTDIREYFEFKPESYLASTTIEKIHNDPPFRGLSFKTSSTEGALLTFPDGAIARDLENVRRFREYAEANIESWYRYVNGPRGREAKNGEVRLVTGYDKATSWGMVAVANMNQQNVHYLKYRSVGDAGATTASIPLYKWEYTGLAEARVGPDLQEIEDLRRDDDSHVAVGGKHWNQCLFMRTLNIMLSDDDFANIDRELESASHELQNWGNFSSSTRNADSPAQTDSTGQQPVINLANQTGSTSYSSRSTSTVVKRNFKNLIMSTSPSAPTLHPADFLNKTLLEKVPKSRVVITRDEDWCSVIDKDDETMPSPSEIAERVLAAYHVKEENGVVFLEPKKHQYQSEDIFSSSPLHDSMPLAESTVPPYQRDANSPSFRGHFLVHHRNNSYTRTSSSLSLPGDKRSRIHNIDDDDKNIALENLAHARKEATRRRRIESEQRRRDEIREGYAKLKDVLPVSNQKSSKISLLERATNYIAQLESERMALIEKVKSVEAETKRLYAWSEMVSLSTEDIAPETLISRTIPDPDANALPSQSPVAVVGQMPPPEHSH